MKRILVVSHCLLNTASKVERYKDASIQSEEELRRRILKKALEEGAGAEGWAIIQTKLGIVKDYMRTNFQIDMDKLRAAIDRRCDELQRMDINALP